MYRCRPAVPLAVLMCLPVLLFFSAPPARTKLFAQCSAGMLLATAGRWLAFRADMARPLRVCLRWELRCHWMDVCGTPFALCWRPADAAARCPPCVKVLPALGVILLLVVFALPGACVARCVLTRDGRCHDGLLLVAMTVAAFSAHTSTHTSLFFCRCDCSRAVVRA
ncbi:hypothetical protein Tc00.1047053510935.10 [Trypanosoma cruzi]|uniref:Uncharacterized protein n=1 Tax=Trypanosoma cruzi (strain CL Brener) TaxID=353153 RepID=Q4CMC4_TRYCC|nr:hypothetical protein Tc00.1047053510935.10 [Trypanosoma cruzi]EAN81425.1 hypothetical protein Tc00.1047053510935.10 [Trypanosoma cruzi]|eukprot:XP_802871.1 hypothetical protein [Trypanosoma cruzi strain CL Brener]